MLVNCPPHDPWTDQEQMKCCSCWLSTPSTDREQPILQSCELIAEDSEHGSILTGVGSWDVNDC